MKKEVLVRRNGDYLRVPVESIYVDDGNESRNINMLYPIKDIQKIDGDRTLWVRYSVKNIEHPVRVNLEQVKGALRSNGFNDTRQFERYINKYGLRLKTSKGFYWEIKAEKEDENGKYKFLMGGSKLKSKYKQRPVYFPNIYPDGSVCWGNVMSENPVMNLEDGGRTFLQFIESTFNTELESNFTGTNLKRYLQSKIREEDDKEEDKLVIDLKRKLRDKIDSNIIKGDLMLLIISSVWDMDNIEIDNRI